MAIGIIRTRASFAKQDCGTPATLLNWTKLYDNEFTYITKDAIKLFNKYGRNTFPDMGFLSYPGLWNASKPSEIIEIVDNIIRDYNLTEIVLNYSEIFPPFRRGEELKAKKMLDKCIAEDKFTTFQSVRRQQINGIITKAFGDRIPLHHIVVDPLEMNWPSLVDKGGTTVFAYDNQRIGAKYHPYVQTALKFEQPEKKYKFSFGFVVSNQERQEIWNSIKAIKDNDDINILVKNRYDKEDKTDTLVKQGEYDDLIDNSEFTLAVPSHSNIDFSSLRFWEAFSKGCIPLIDNRCAYEQEFKHFPEIMEIYRTNNLIINSTNLIEVLDSLDYNSILDKIKSTNDYINLNDYTWLQQKAQNTLTFSETF